MKVYIFGNEKTAEVFQMTAHAFYGEGEDVGRIGSVLVMREEVYQCVIDKTYAIPASFSADVAGQTTKEVLWGPYPATVESGNECPACDEDRADALIPKLNDNGVKYIECSSCGAIYYPI